MTENEARTKWCPMVRLENVTPKFHGKIDGDPGRTAKYTASCIGSDCAMWRWSKSVSEGYGYCGLAGKP